MRQAYWFQVYGAHWAWKIDLCFNLRPPSLHSHFCLHTYLSSCFYIFSICFMSVCEAHSWACLHVCTSCACSACSASRGQKRALEPLGLELQKVLSCECWEPNIGPLEGQPRLLCAPSSILLLISWAIDLLNYQKWLLADFSVYTNLLHRNNYFSIFLWIEIPCLTNLIPWVKLEFKMMRTDLLHS